MSINKTILIFLVLFHITLHAPRSLRNSQEDGGSSCTTKNDHITETHKPLLIATKNTKTQSTGSLDWTVTTTQELTNSIDYIRQTISQSNPEESVSQEKKDLLKSLAAKESHTKKTIKQAKRKGDKAYNEASFCVNRLSMAVNWYKFALNLLSDKLSKVGSKNNLSYKEFKSLEDKSKESLFYEVYAHACSCYPDAQAAPNTKELTSIVELLVDDLLKPKSPAPQENNKNHSEKQAVENSTHRSPAENDATTKLWSEIKGLKTQQIEQTIANKQNIQQLQRDLAMAQKSLQEHKSALEKASENTKSLTQKVEKASAERLEKSIQVSSLEQRIQMLEKSHKHVVDKLNQEIARLTKEIEQREKTIAKWSEQKAKYAAKEKELEESMTKLKKETLAHSIELKAARSQKEQALEALKKQKNSVEKKLAKFNEQQLAKEKEVLSKQIKIQQLEKELKQKNIELTEKKLAIGKPIANTSVPAPSANPSSATIPAFTDTPTQTSTPITNQTPAITQPTPLIPTAPITTTQPTAEPTNKQVIPTPAPVVPKRQPTPSSAVKTNPAPKPTSAPTPPAPTQSLFYNV